MILKVLGGLLILSSCGLMGMAVGNKFALRPKDIRKFRASIQMLETEIIFGCTPLPQAFKNISAKVEEPLKMFYSTISEDLLSGMSYSLNAAWSRETDRLVKSNCLNAADKELITEFGLVLGSSDREDQKKHFELFYVQLKQHEEIAEEARNKNERMYKSLGLLSGLVIFILLV